MTTTVYYKRDDLQYRLTLGWLQDRRIPFDLVDVAADPAIKGRVESDGMFGNPVVYVRTPHSVGRWQHFNPVLLNAYLGEVRAA